MKDLLTSNHRWAAHKHCMGKDLETDTMTPKEMVRAVYGHFRREYDGGAGPWSYKNIEVEVEGMPEGIPFGKPSKYGADAL